MQISELEPKKVFRFFEEISGIPHGSGNTKELEKYCLEFAKKRGLKSFQDTYGNIILFKPASPGYENHEPVILQGHLDMVCEKDADCLVDMEKDAIRLQTDGTVLWAKGTTLGADDGIAVAFILAILDSENLRHPPLEALFTTDEEIGLIGANKLDASRLKGKRLINIDSEEEGILTVSCAGATRVNCEIPVTEKDADECAIEISVSGLLGGHSGVDIGTGRRNAGKVLAEALDYISESAPFGISSIHFGGRLNVIPQTATATICAKGKDCAAVFSAVSEFDAIMKSECCSTEPDVAIAAKNANANALMATDENGTKKLICILLQMPHGVFAMSPTIKDLVQTSLNLGSFVYENGKTEAGFMIRSNRDYGKQSLKRRILHLSEYFGGKAEMDTDYPAWEYRPDSPLRNTMVEAYEDLYGEVPVISAMHAGLECGIIAEKIPGADLVSFGPTMRNVHTPKEELDVHSAERSFRYLLHILEKL